ncbi:hypothetical protein [Cellvibrio sp. QJXJ]|uniref:hypothetical protein n=1 Tax=Cellvibrio sp. QJXJ TaxID=2964606 RepID=UPI0021C457E5|nr:hypothetical protein [Cellvibrio sp. QJXJ]UUA71433.1 hypothetical protein NNX04_13560 [Cellvibrio sp. QJXJ]
MSQNNPAPINTNSTYDKDDEIDLLGLLRALLKTWKVWFVALVLVSAIFGAVKAIQTLATTPETVYSKPIRLTFPNAHLQQFPSGAKFAHSDIIAPAIAQQVFERNNLSAYGLKISDFQRGLSATPYSPTYPLIIERYSRRLSDKRLTVENIADLQKQMDEEIVQATAGEVLISWRLDKHVIPIGVAEKVLADLPALWAEKAIKEKGVLEIQAHLTTAKSLNLTLIKEEELLIAGDILTDKINLLRGNINELSQFEGSQTIADPKTGMRLNDLNNALDDLSNYDIASVLASIRIQGLSNFPELSKYYYTDKLNRLNIKLKGLEYEASSVRDSYRQPNTSAGLGADGNTNNQMLAPQLNSDILDKLASLSGDLEREKYNQQLNQRWLSLTRQISTVKSTIAETEQLLAAIKHPTNANPGAIEALAQAKARLPGILNQLTEYFDVSERIASQMRTELVGIKDELFVPVSNSVLENKTSISIKELLITWIALMFLTSVLVIPTCMIRNALKAKSLQQTNL